MPPTEGADPQTAVAVLLPRAERRSPVPVTVPPPWNWEECEIDRRRRYVTADFFATAWRPSGERYVADRSPRFRSWRIHLRSDTGPAAQAHAQLLDWLVADGWETVGSGPQWFKTRLRRRMRPAPRQLSETLWGAAVRRSERS